MSTKRTSTESGNDEQKNDASDPLFQQEDNAKRAKLSPLSDTTLHDLPIELLEHILIKVVIMEVKGMNLSKCVWKEKADPVISRLRTVCLQWNSILETDFFRNEVHRTLIAAHGKILLELLYKSPIQQDIWGVTALKDEIFMLYSPLDQDDAVINVYDRNNIAEIKDVISLPGRNPVGIAACSVSNCLYVESTPSVFRVTKDEELQFNISPWINDHTMPGPTISVSASGNLLIFSEAPAKIRIYNASGSLKHEISEIMLSRGIDELKHELVHVEDVIQKSNGNLVLVLFYHGECKLIEIDTSVNVVRQYQSSLSAGGCVNFADIHGRIMITDVQMGMELLDSEFNLLDCSNPLRDAGHFRDYLHYTKYDNERNEVMCISGDHSDNALLTIFRFTAE